MTEKKEKQIKKIITGITIGLLLLAAGYIGFIIYKKEFNVTLFTIVMSAFVIIYMLIIDILEPILLKRFQNFEGERRAAYLKVIGLDIIGIGALLYYLIGINNQQQDILLPLLIYMVAAMTKRKFKDEFMKTE